MKQVFEKYGFTLERSRSVAELGGTLLELRHGKTGAQLIWLDNGLDNKLFCVTFQTIPQDSTGVFHILEHSVLCGSDKYPVREPFVELLKSSMNTFLNAMTFSDKTMYPVASRNDQDFLNLTEVYLDAVFAPRMLTDPNIFYQEGWHADVLEAPCFKGVVYNEMKGAMANVDDRLEQGMLELLFPDTCYRHNSGGAPEHIPELTYAQFTDSYHRFYHPSNARFYLDGSIPLEKTLDLISQYLERDYGPALPATLALQTPLVGERTWYYEVSPEEPAEKKAMLALGKILCSWQDRTTVMAAQVLCDVLAGSNDAPLKRAVLATGLAEDLYLSVNAGIAQPYFCLQLRNMAPESQQTLLEVIKNTAAQLLRDGLDKQALEAALHAFSYALRQKREPQGLVRAIDMMSSWLYGGDALQYLVHDQVLEQLRAMVEGNAFEQLLEQLLLSGDLSLLRMLPSATLGQEDRAREQARLTQVLENTDRDILRRENQALLRWQQTEDTPQQLATIPVLTLDQVGPMPPQPQTLQREDQGVTVLYHSINTDGIEYLNLYFSLKDLELEQLSSFAFLPELLGKLPTRYHTALELDQQIKLCIGSLSFCLEVFPQGSDLTQAVPCLAVRAGYLKEDREKAWALLLEILTATELDNADAIREILLQAVEGAKRFAIGRGNALASTVVGAHYSACGAAQEAVEGYTAMKALQTLAEEYDLRIQPLIRQYRHWLQQAVCRSRLVASLTATEYTPLTRLLEQLPQGLPLEREAGYKANLPHKLGIVIPAQTAFAVKGYHLSRCGMDYNGSLSLLENIQSLANLWNQIRVQGGAYGAGMVAGRRGSLMCYSYRDPSPARSLEIYDRLWQFTEQFREPLDKYIISCVASMDPLRTPAAQGRTADLRWFSGIDDAQLEATRQQLLAADHRALAAWRPALEQMAREGAVCVVAGRETLEACGDLTLVSI